MTVSRPAVLPQVLPGFASTHVPADQDRRLMDILSAARLLDTIGGDPSPPVHGLCNVRDAGLSPAIKHEAEDSPTHQPMVKRPRGSSPLHEPLMPQQLKAVPSTLHAGGQASCPDSSLLASTSSLASEPLDLLHFHNHHHPQRYDPQHEPQQYDGSSSRSSDDATGTCAPAAANAASSHFDHFPLGRFCGAGPLAPSVANIVTAAAGPAWAMASMVAALQAPPPPQLTPWGPAPPFLPPFATPSGATPPWAVAAGGLLGPPPQQQNAFFALAAMMAAQEQQQRLQYHQLHMLFQTAPPQQQLHQQPDAGGGPIPPLLLQRMIAAGVLPPPPPPQLMWPPPMGVPQSALEHALLMQMLGGGGGGPPPPGCCHPNDAGGRLQLPPHMHHPSSPAFHPPPLDMAHVLMMQQLGCGMPPLPPLLNSSAHAGPDPRMLPHLLAAGGDGAGGGRGGSPAALQHAASAPATASGSPPYGPANRKQDGGRATVAASLPPRPRGRRHIVAAADGPVPVKTPQQPACSDMSHQTGLPAHHHAHDRLTAHDHVADREPRAASSGAAAAGGAPVAPPAPQGFAGGCAEAAATPLPRGLPKHKRQRQEDLQNSTRHVFLSAQAAA